MTIYIGDIILLGKKADMHPYLVIGFSNKKIYGVKITSVKNRKDSYISKNIDNADILELDSNDGLKWWSHLNTNEFLYINPTI